MTYLDTHIALNLAENDLRRIDRRARKVIETDQDLRISPMTLLEFEYLREVGKIQLNAEEVVAILAAELGVRVCDASFASIARQSLSEGWTRDAFDRIITAHARLQKARLITRDQNMQDRYALALG